jgi:hypothetical protein
MSGALAVVMSIEATMPRMVFDGPNNGRPSKNRIPVSSGRAKRKPKIFFATIGVPFANVISTNNCRIRRACIPAAYLNTDCRSIRLSETIGASGDSAQRFHLFPRISVLSLEAARINVGDELGE